MDKTKEAIKFICSCCPRIGSFYGTSDVVYYLKKVASDIEHAQPSKLFQARYKEHVAYAIDMIASNGFTSPPSAIASVYLNTRFEYYFRILSGKINADGTWISSAAREDAEAGIGFKDNKKRVINVALTYKIMKTNTSHPITKICVELDSSLYSGTSSGSKIKDIGDRIKYLRDRVVHGHWGDISSDAIFYGLMTSIIFYNQ